MTEQVSIIAAPIEFDYTNADALSAKRVILLEDIEPSLPAVVRLRRVTIWNQGAVGSGYANGLMGDLSLAVDPDRQYTESSGFPVVEMIKPKYLKPLGVLEMRPGVSWLSKEVLEPPVVYRRNRDCIVIAPESNNSSGRASIFISFSFEADGDIGVDPMPSGASDAFRLGLDSTSANNQDICIRNLIPMLSAGLQVRVRFRSFTTPSVVNHASVGAQSGSGSSTIATPVELTFSGASGIALAAYQNKWSDWVNLPTTSAQNLLVTCSLFNGSNCWAYKAANGCGNWSTATDSWNTATLQGSATWQAGRTHIIDRVQVK